MGRVGEESYRKSQLVIEICGIWDRARACAHLHRPDSKQSPPFIDWYLLLGVQEKVGADELRKQYHKLALQLHPDKNTHPKAETAFKLVLEGYACLSDNGRRAEFNMARKNSFCTECNHPNRAAKWKGMFATEKLIKTSKVQQRMKEMGARFMEEARVMENCLMANTALRKGSFASGPALRKDHPVFNPSDYPSQVYPYHRARNHRRQNNFCCLKTENRGKTGKQDSPVFELRTGKLDTARFNL